MGIRKLIAALTGDLEDKRHWRASVNRIRSLPGSYRTAAEAMKDYLMATGFGGATGGKWAPLYEDLADLFEQAAAARTPLRDIIGNDPVDFAEEFASNYSEKRWIDVQRRKLTEAVERAERGQTADHEGNNER